MSTIGLRGAKSLNPARWLGLPMLLCILATMVFATPVRVFGLGLPQPIFPLAPAFAWAIIRPSILPPFALLLLGLFLDVFWGGPQGLWPLCLLAAYASILVVRRQITGHDFLVRWAWYAGASAVALLAGFSLMTMTVGSPPNLIATLLVYYLPTLLLFPLAHWLIERYEDADVRFR
jgi:rod shape-determining protein MreD